MLYEASVMGAFVGFLVDRWLKRLTIKDPIRLVIAVAVGIIVGFATYNGHLAVF